MIGGVAYRPVPLDKIFEAESACEASGVSIGL